MIEVDSRYFRPTEVNALLGDSSKAKKNLGWHLLITAKFSLSSINIFDEYSKSFLVAL